MLASMTWRVGITVVLGMVGCAGTQVQDSANVQRVEVVPHEYLMEWAGNWHEPLDPPSDDPADLKSAIRGTRGTERQEATLRYLLSLLYQMEDARAEEDRLTIRRTTREFRSTVRKLRRARGTLAATRDFVDLLFAWRGEESRALRLAERFANQHEDESTLHSLAWMIRGEILFSKRRYSNAAEAYRYLLGQLDHPLYPFALWRTAAVHGERGEDTERDEILRQIVQLGCPDDAAESTAIIAAAAASEVGIGRRGERFETCRAGAAPRSDIDNELPPGYR